MTSSGSSSLVVWKHGQEFEEPKQECEEKKQEKEENSWSFEKTMRFFLFLVQENLG